MIILGLDISSSRIGYCWINENEDLLLVDEIKLKPSQSLEERADIFKKAMEIIKEHSEVDYVFIEQPFMAFSGGKTTAATMATAATAAPASWTCRPLTESSSPTAWGC